MRKKSRKRELYLHIYRCIFCQLVSLSRHSKLRLNDFRCASKELSSYLSRVAMHSSHSPSSLGRSDVITRIMDHALLAFLTHAALVRPLDVQQQQQFRFVFRSLVTNYAVKRWFREDRKKTLMKFSSEGDIDSNQAQLEKRLRFLSNPSKNLT